MSRLGLCCGVLMFWLSGPALAVERCEFAFGIDTQSSAFQALVAGASERGGFWRPIREAPDDVQEVATFVGRLDVCLMTPDGKPRQVTVRGQSVTLRSPYVTHCTAALLPDNRLLTNRHCFYDDTLAGAGFTIVQEARINFGYVSADFTDDVKTFLVANREVAQDAERDAMVLQVIGADANEALGGHLPMRMETRALPRRALTMIHHPRAQAQQFSSGTCQVHPEQAALPETASQLRHSCETAGGSSGSLLLDARSLAVVGLHNQGGLHARGGYNGGHKIAAVEAALGLGFRPAAQEVPPQPRPDPEVSAQAALTDALQIDAADARRRALEAVIADFPDSRAAVSAGNTLAFMAPRPVSPESAATEALTRALQMTNEAERSAALGDVADGFAGTAAARSAEAMLALTRAPAPSGLPDPDGGVVFDGDTLRIGGTVFGRGEEGVEVLSAGGDSLLRTGDRIVGLGGESLTSVPALVAGLRAAEEAGRSKIVLNVLRVLRMLEIALPVPERITEQTDAAPSEAEARAALDRALAVSDEEMQARAIAKVQDRYPDTAAAKSAKMLLSALDRASAPLARPRDPAPVAPVGRSAPTRDDILARGRLSCAVSDLGMAEAAVDYEGRLLGAGADFCRALAASVLGDPEAVDFLPATVRTSIETLAYGEADVLLMAPDEQPAGLSNMRVEQVGLLAGDGIGLMIPNNYGVSNALQLDGATLCLIPGTESEWRIAEFFRANNMAYESVMVSSDEEAASRYFEGACDLIVMDTARLARIRLWADDPEVHVILPERLTENPYRSFVRTGDPAWRDSVALLLDSLPAKQ